MRNDSHPSTGEPAVAWWREWQALALVGLVLVAYFLRAGALPLRGEESTRAQVAFEMVYWHDWLVPRIQGEPFRIRPPLQNWVNAGCCLLVGNWDVYTIRLPSLLATLATTLLIYGYARARLRRLGAFAAAAAFATMAEMFKMGMYAETEALFIFLLSAALLVWHWGVLRCWPDWLTYTLGYGLMALATLTKGVQAPLYFVGAVVAYLVLTRDWRRLFGWGHVAGMLVGAALFLAWTVPYGFVMDWPAVKDVWLADRAVHDSGRLFGWDPSDVLLHVATYPFEVIAATLPWCFLLVPYATPTMWRCLGTARPQVLFVTVAIAVAWPSCWIPPMGLPRYFAALFPCIAVLIGVVVERCAEAEAGTALANGWRRYRIVLGALMAASAVLVVALAVAAQTLPPLLEPLAEPLPVALGYGLAIAALAILVLRSGQPTPVHVQRSFMAMVAFLVLTFTGLVTDVRVRRAVHAETELAALRAKLPPSQQLVSLDGQVDSLFNYLYRTPIVQPRRCAPFGREAPDDVEYFCFTSPGGERPTLPFAWEEIGTVNLDRNRQPVPERVIVVGRRLSAGPGVAAQAVSGRKQ